MSLTLLSASEVARRNGCALLTVLRAIQSGDLPAEKIAGRWVVQPDAYYRWSPRPVGRPRITTP